MVTDKSLITKNGTRGSEWRLWDLHFHTPSSFDYKDKGVTNKQLIESLRDAGVSVVAVTDHHTIDINRIKELQELGAFYNITVLPGIEFCSELGGSESVHFIGIFSESADLTTIWTKIQGQCNLTPNEITQKGVEKIYCPFEKTAQLIKDLGGIISIHAGRKSNSVECIKNNLLVKQELKQNLLTKFKPILEVGKETDINDYQSIVFPSIHLILPTIICSDNHDIKEYIRPNLWIKADPTFEGLKQILYEPLERVAVKESCPDYKPSYMTLESVELSENGFWNQTVLLNRNLNTIIGGRSTGKSTFLSVIASKFSAINSDDPFINEHNRSVKVRWSDGNEAYDREIEFLRQSYMFDIAKDPDETNRLLMNIVRDNEDCRNVLIEYERQVSTIIADSQRILNSLWDVFSQGLEKQKTIKQIGDKAGLEKEITNLVSQQKIILEQTNIDPILIQNYNKYTEELAKIKALNESILHEIKSLQNLKSSWFLLPNKSITYTGISAEIAAIISSTVTEQHQKAQSVILNTIDEQIKNLDKRKNENETIAHKLLISPEYQTAKQIWEQNKKLTAVNKLINEENAKLQKLNQAIDDFNNFKTQTDKLRKELFNLHRNFFAACVEASKAIQIMHEGIEIRGEIEFLNNKMQEYIESVLDQRVTEMKTVINDFCNKYEKYEETFLMDFIKKANNAKLTIKGNTSPMDILSYIFSTNWYKLKIGLYYENDGFHDMSQGKQAFVILKLLLDFSDKKCPILIDQPEDSLDNRAIYNELVSYIRRKKKERQIVLVTHNPNIVVGADAEEIIVANQQGTKSPNEENLKFQYVSGSLENTNNTEKDMSVPLLFRMGIREHVCEILEGGREAFIYREKKYGFVN